MKALRKVRTKNYFKSVGALLIDKKIARSNARAIYSKIMKLINYLSYSALLAKAFSESALEASLRSLWKDANDF